MDARPGALPMLGLPVDLTVPAAKSRDFEAQALVHLDVLYRIALWLTHNRPEADDLVQDACLRAFTYFDRFTPGTNCRAWLVTILRNVFLNRISRRGREVLEDDLEPETATTASATAPSSDSDTPEVEFFRRALSADVDHAVRELPLVFREAVILVDLEGFGYREAALALGCPVGTVMSRLYRGRGRLRHGLRHLVHAE